MEGRFHHDFSAVRVHSGDQAAASAAAIGAAAYAVGNNIVFGPGGYAPGTSAGRHLLSHELSHVLQQGGAAVPPSQLRIGPAGSAAEAEADRAADAVSGSRPIPPLRRTAPAVMRTLQADNPSQKIPNPGGSGLDQTNAQTLEQYLRSISPQGNARVDAASGMASMDPDFCPKTRAARGWLGLKEGASKGAKIGAYFLGVGAIPGALIGAIAGGISGLAGDDSQTAESKMPASASCVCGAVNHKQAWHVQFVDALDDDHRPVTGNGLIIVPSPNSSKIAGAATKGGQLQNAEPWLVFAHELCGHATVEMREHDNEGAVEGQDLRHHRTVERENEIRSEHGIAARGFRLRDPYCGQSFVRDRNNPNGAPQWLHSKDTKNQEALRNEPVHDIDPPQGLTSDANQTDLDACQHARENELGDLARRYTVDQSIPDTAQPTR